MVQVVTTSCEHSCNKQQLNDICFKGSVLKEARRSLVKNLVYIHSLNFHVCVCVSTPLDLVPVCAAHMSPCKRGTSSSWSCCVKTCSLLTSPEKIRKNTDENQLSHRPMNAQIAQFEFHYHATHFVCELVLCSCQRLVSWCYINMFLTFEVVSIVFMRMVMKILMTCRIKISSQSISFIQNMRRSSFSMSPTSKKNKENNRDAR